MEQAAAGSEEPHCSLQSRDPSLLISPGGSNASRRQHRLKSPNRCFGLLPAQESWLGSQSLVQPSSNSTFPTLCAKPQHNKELLTRWAVLGHLPSLLLYEASQSLLPQHFAHDELCLEPSGVWAKPASSCARTFLAAGAGCGTASGPAPLHLPLASRRSSLEGFTGRFLIPSSTIGL